MSLSTWSPHHTPPAQVAVTDLLATPKHTCARKSSVATAPNPGPGEEPGASAQGRGRSQQQLRPQRAQLILAVPLSHTFTICLTPPPCPALRSRPPPELQAKIRVSSRPCLCPRLSKVSAPEKLAPAPQLLFQVFPTLAQPTIWLMSLCQPELLSSPPRMCPPPPKYLPPTMICGITFPSRPNAKATAFWMLFLLLPAALCFCVASTPVIPFTQASLHSDV